MVPPHRLPDAHAAYFDTDPRIAIVRPLGRQDYSLLTKIQSCSDAQLRARAWRAATAAGLDFNFNGTAGCSAPRGDPGCGWLAARHAHPASGSELPRAAARLAFPAGFWSPAEGSGQMDAPQVAAARGPDLGARDPAIEPAAWRQGGALPPVANLPADVDPRCGNVPALGMGWTEMLLIDLALRRSVVILQLLHGGAAYHSPCRRDRSLREQHTRGAPRRFCQTERRVHTHAEVRHRLRATRWGRSTTSRSDQPVIETRAWLYFTARPSYLRADQRNLRKALPAFLMLQVGFLYMGLLSIIRTSQVRT